jgi:hypothetical protein
MWVGWASASCSPCFTSWTKSTLLRAPREIRQRKKTAPETWKFDGLPNLFFLAVILGAVFVTTRFFARRHDACRRARLPISPPKNPSTRQIDFNFHPIREVAILFAGIFATMMPALDWLDVQRGRCSARNPAPGIFLLGHGHTVHHAGQRADVSRFFERAFGATGAREIGELLVQNALRISIGHQRRRGLFRRGHLHRQWPEFHGQSHRRPAKNPHADVSGIYLQIHAAVPVADAAGGLAGFLSAVEIETF